MTSPPAILRLAFDAAVAAARPERWLPGQLEGVRPPAGVIRVLALGKAAGPLARVASQSLSPHAVEGLAIGVADEAAPPAGFRWMAGSHPVPDRRSLAAGEAALAFAADTAPDDLLLVLISGGASAAACAPIDGVELETKASLTRVLLGSGAAIAEINAVRRALSRLKGGGLARASRGPVVTLAMSDVPDDALHDIGSGPAVPSPTGVAEAVDVLRRRAPGFLPDLEGPMRRHAAGQGPLRPVSARVAFRVDDALGAAADVLGAHGWPVVALGSLAGAATDTAAAHARLVVEARARRAILSGGELSVSVPPGTGGVGGRNLHYLLALAVQLSGRSDVWALAADTDGRDGAAPVAGAWLDPDLTSGLDRREAQAALDAHDSFGFFRRHGRLLATGPTGVNVGDLRLILVDPRRLA